MLSIASLLAPETTRAPSGAAIESPRSGNRTNDAGDSLRGELRTLRLPPAKPGLRREYWSGLSWQLGSAAYWEDLAGSAEPYESHALGRSFREEIGICLLGGYGVPSPMAAAAFDLLRFEGIFDEHANPSRAQVDQLLHTDLTAWGFGGRYRFPRQRALRISAAMASADRVDLGVDDRALRDALMDFPGIGPKTASWIVRNMRGSDEVAIIDIHIERAGLCAGVFDRAWRLPRDYALFEAAFLGWAEHGGLSASHLDSCIWGLLSEMGQGGRYILGVETLAQVPNPVWSVDPAFA